jgi:hypothetical protein
MKNNQRIDELKKMLELGVISQQEFEALSKQQNESVPKVKTSFYKSKWFYIVLGCTLSIVLFLYFFEKSKSINSNLINVILLTEYNIQQGSLTQFERGETAKGSLIEELYIMTKDEAGSARAQKIKMLIDMMEKIDRNVADFIKYVDDLKLELIAKVEGLEKVKTAKHNYTETIVWRKYDPSNPILPAIYNLQAIIEKENTDVPTKVILGESISMLDPAKKGLELWEKFKGLRSSIVEIAGNYKEGEKNTWKLKVKEINSYANFQDLEKQILKMFKAPGNKVNPEDLEALVSIYQVLTKQEFAVHHEAKNIHWLGRTFDHAPLVGALATLSSMQNEILAARAKALNLLKSKVTTH